jgi:hypothetical protein
MPFMAVRDGDQDRFRCKWWDRFWLRCGLGLAATVLLLKITGAVFGLRSQIASRPCVTETR